MTVTTISQTTATAITDFKTALQNKGKLTTLHYESATGIVVTTPYVSKVLKFTGNTLYWGDSWTSGLTITNELMINNQSTSSALGKKLTLSDKVLAFSSYDQNTNVAVVGKTVDGKDFSIGAQSNSTYGPWQRTTVNGVPSYIVNDMKGGTLLNASNNYVIADIYSASASYVLNTNALDGVKLIGKPMAKIDVEILSDNAVAIPLGYVGYDSGSFLYSANLYIPNGNL